MFIFFVFSGFPPLVFIDLFNVGGVGAYTVIMGFWGVAAGGKLQRSVLDYNSASWSQPWVVMFLDD